MKKLLKTVLPLLVIGGLSLYILRLCDTGPSQPSTTDKPVTLEESRELVQKIFAPRTVVLILR